MANAIAIFRSGGRAAGGVLVAGVWYSAIDWSAADFADQSAEQGILACAGTQTGDGRVLQGAVRLVWLRIVGVSACCQRAGVQGEPCPSAAFGQHRIRHRLSSLFGQRWHLDGASRPPLLENKR